MQRQQTWGFKLGASHQATAVDDATEAEWTNLDLSGSWTNWTGPFNSVLKIHAAGFITPTGSLQGRGIEGGYWSSTKEPGNFDLTGVNFHMNSSDAGINQTTATSGGNVTSNGGHTVSARGVCWSTSPNPTIADSKTTDGPGTGSQKCNICCIFDFK